MPRDIEELRQSLSRTASDIDEFTRNVPDWEICITLLLENLEFYAMADDPDHPQQFLHLLARIKAKIERRIQRGDWD